MIYIYEGILSSGVTMTQLGEEQFGSEGINFGFTLDGTKDSTKFEVLSYRRESVKPFTIVCHNETSSWWIVQKDKVERYTNEQGYIYKHSLQCIGAIELLNARDLTNCGFNQNKYTLEQFILRLFSLSNFEFKTPTLVTNGNIDLTQKVDYIKTFENYTLLSALREILDGYNQCAKLHFNRDLATNKITSCVIYITPKTGDSSLSVLNIDNDFNDVQEQRNMDKNSYGTIVVSNVDNAVSSLTKNFPNVGGAKLCSLEYTTTPENAIIKLPSNAFYVDSVEMCMTLRLAVREYYSGSWHYSYADYGGYFNVANNFDKILEIVENALDTNFGQFYPPDFEAKLNSIKTQIYNSGRVIFKQGVLYNAIDQTYAYKDNSYAIKVLKLKSLGSSYADASIVLMDEETANGTHNPWNCIKWRRGSDEISGFGWLAYDLATTNAGTTCRVPLLQTEFKQDNNVLYQFKQGANQVQLIIAASETTSNYFITIDNFSHTSDRRETLFKVKYTPMTDLKVVLDNNEENKHTHLYNQNGKLTDTLAFSKLINSYKTEIESENIVKYHTCYELFELGTTTFRNIECPKLGQIVLDSDNEQYIISNVSYNLQQNEPNQYASGGKTYTQYYVECEYSLSKNIATKSLMVNPNTNIRDYGIPQKYNVRRTHLFRDFWEIDHSKTPHLDLPHQELSSVLNIGYLPQTYNEHTAIMRIDYSQEISGSTRYYYQLESTTFMLKKAIFEVVEFKDNNIIGYDCQNVSSGFNISRLLSGLLDLKNTPISYVDKNGEFKDIRICMCDKDQMKTIYNQYIENNEITTDLPIQDMMIFIPQDIFDYATDNKDYTMIYLDYNKDALEVPVFEYACQIDDTNYVIVGENILDNKEEDIGYLYSYYLVAKGTINNNNWGKLSIKDVLSSSSYSNYYHIWNGVKLWYDGIKMKLELYGGSSVTVGENETTGGYSEKQSMSNVKDYDLVIVRHAVAPPFSYYYDQNGNRCVRTRNDLMFVIRHTENANIEDDTLSLSLNAWRLD